MRNHALLWMRGKNRDGETAMTKKAKKNPTAAEAYAERRERIRKAMERIEGRLMDHESRHQIEPERWDLVGDLTHVAELLEGVAGFCLMPDSRLGVSTYRAPVGPGGSRRRVTIPDGE